MDTFLVESSSNKAIGAVIEVAISRDMPAKKLGWQFTWKTLYKTEGSEFYKLTLWNSKDELQGIIMLSLMFDEMLYMNNIEVAPHNIGSNGKYDNVAGNLIAFACRRSFVIGKNDYRGYLTFESKSELVSLYRKKYGATHATGSRMFIDPKSGIQLINKFLKV